LINLLRVKSFQPVKIVPFQFSNEPIKMSQTWDFASQIAKRSNKPPVATLSDILSSNPRPTRHDTPDEMNIMSQNSQYNTLKRNSCSQPEPSPNTPIVSPRSGFDSKQVLFEKQWLVTKFDEINESLKAIKQTNTSNDEILQIKDLVKNLKFDLENTNERIDECRAECKELFNLLMEKMDTLENRQIEQFDIMTDVSLSVGNGLHQISSQINSQAQLKRNSFSRPPKRVKKHEKMLEQFDRFYTIQCTQSQEQNIFDQEW
jgi:hypothetical protein